MSEMNKEMQVFFKDWEKAKVNGKQFLKMELLLQLPNPFDPPEEVKEKPRAKRKSRK